MAPIIFLDIAFCKLKRKTFLYTSKPLHVTSFVNMKGQVPTFLVRNLVVIHAKNTITPYKVILGSEVTTTNPIFSLYLTHTTAFVFCCFDYFYILSALNRTFSTKESIKVIIVEED